MLKKHDALAYYVMRGRPNLNRVKRGGRKGKTKGGKYSRGCYSRFVLSRLKCTLKGNRERRCNFPRETEHEIKRGDAILSRCTHFTFLPSRQVSSTPSGFLIHPGLFFLSLVLDASRRGLTIIFPREVRRSTLYHVPYLACNPPLSLSLPWNCTWWHQQSAPSYLPRRVLKIEKNA